jgi:hypothetical protein
VFTVEQRNALRDRVLQLAQADARVVAGAAVGSLAVGQGDRFSDLDLTFAVADEVPIGTVLGDWTSTLGDESAAIQLTDLAVGSTIYRVFLLPEALQFDLSMTPASEFRAAGPRFRLLFGKTAAGISDAHRPAPSVFIPTPLNAHDLFGWGVIYGLHARACIARGRVWQAEHYVGAVRDHALSLACLSRELAAAQARGYDDLPPETIAQFAHAHVGVLAPAALRTALSACLSALVREAAQTALPSAGMVAERIGELVDHPAAGTSSP